MSTVLRLQMALLTVPGGEARTMVSPQPTTAHCTRRARRRGSTPRGDSAIAGYAGPPAGQGSPHLGCGSTEAERCDEKDIEMCISSHVLG
jgi:hypothetical protein